MLIFLGVTKAGAVMQRINNIVVYTMGLFAGMDFDTMIYPLI